MRILLYGLILALIGINFYLYFIDRDIDENEQYRLLIIDDRIPVTEPKDSFKMIDSVFIDKGIDKKWIYTKKTDSLWFKYVKVPSKYTLARYNLFFQKIMKENGVGIKTAEEYELSNKLVFTFNANDSTGAVVELRITPSLETDINLGGNISIVFDAMGEQWGQQWVKNLLSSEIPFSISIMPSKWASKTVYDEALKYKKTVLASIPMEPETGNIDKEKYKILSGMNEYTVEFVLEKILSEFPSAPGVLSYKGGKAIGDLQTMDNFIKSLKKKGLFYIENSGSAESFSQIICADHAVQFGYIAEYFDTSVDAVEKFTKIYDSVLNGENAILLFESSEKMYEFVMNEIISKKDGIGIIGIEEILRLSR
jgi:polysaccharide deacetylase 2 family uncharacterized protein YibQ